MKLFSYQELAVRQLLPESSALIGDDMGLGKTVEGTVLDAARRNKHGVYYQARTLVVTVKSVMDVWRRHYEAWTKLKVYVYDPKNRKAFLAALNAVDERGRPKYHVFVTHWAAIRLMPELQKVKWFQITGDEIQAIKNRKAQVSVAFKKIRAQYKLGLSGTWADNHPADGYSVLNWLWPDQWKSYWAYERHHVVTKHHPADQTCPVEGCDKWHRTSYKEVCGIAHEDEIHRKMGRGYIRRLKEDVLKDLPDKYYSTVEVDLDPKQRVAYDKMAKEMLAWIGEHEDEPIAAPIVVAQLMRLQQFAVAYGQMVPGYRTIRHEDGTTEREETEVLRLTDPSTKLDAVMDIIEATNGQVVVFSQSKQAVDLLAARLERKHISAGILTGDTKQADRDHLVEEFQAGRLRVFAGTIRAGGVGLTLTAASTVVFIDRAWSPSANKQAEDRLHRVGQTNAVHVIDIMARDTIDLERNEKILMKWEWLRALLNGKKLSED